MTDSGVELLERALAYTRGALLHVRPTHLSRPTPCATWNLDQLLDHMADALDAFTDGAAGRVDVDPPRRELDVRVAVLQTKACGLLGAWNAPGTPSVVRVGGLPVPTGVVVRAAALEIATHGWDVAQATGRRTPVPDALARELCRVAPHLVADDDRGERFAAPLPLPAAATATATTTTEPVAPAEALLAFLGRHADWRTGWARPA